MLDSICDIQCSFSSSESVLQIVMFLPLSSGICSAGAATPMRVLILTGKLVSHLGHCCSGSPMKLIISPQPQQRNRDDAVGYHGHQLLLHAAEADFAELLLLHMVAWGLGSGCPDLVITVGFPFKFIRKVFNEAVCNLRFKNSFIAYVFWTEINLA